MTRESAQTGSTSPNCHGPRRAEPANLMKGFLQMTEEKKTPQQVKPKRLPFETNSNFDEREAAPRKSRGRGKAILPSGKPENSP
jgi:hypothetical protein